jgi:predicted GNAT family acetyltransferase
LYGTPGWGNAIGSGRRKHLDKIAIGAYDGNTLIGLASSSADCEKMWQIGVDVLPAYRRKGVASSLLTHLATEILKRGFVPYAGCRWANMRSLKTQLAIGFRPVWVDMLASPLEAAAQ